MEGNILLLLCAIQAVALVNGHYSIGYSINNYASENNSLLYDGACCEVNTSTGSGCQEGGCRTTLRLCFRDANHSHTDSDSSCFNAINRRNVNFFFQTPLDVHIISNYFVNRFQVYVRVSHIPTGRELITADFDPPFSDPLVDEAFIEADVMAAPFNGISSLTEMYSNIDGEFGRMQISFSISVQCAMNYFGSACEMLCNSEGTNCTQVLELPTSSTSETTTGTVSSNTPPSTTTASSNTPPLTTTASSNTPPSTGGVIGPTQIDVLPIAVGVAVGVVVLIVIGVVLIILIICCVKKGRSQSWTLNKPPPTNHYTHTRVSEKTHSNNINRVSYIAASEVSNPNNGSKQEVPSKPPPYHPTNDEDRELRSIEIAPAEDFVIANIGITENIDGAGYEVITFQHQLSEEEEEEPKKSELTYITLDIAMETTVHVDSNGKPSTDKPDPTDVRYEQ